MLFSFRLAFDRAEWPEYLSFRVAFGNSEVEAFTEVCVEACSFVFCSLD